jgi:hypothetical protein
MTSDGQMRLTASSFRGERSNLLPLVSGVDGEGRWRKEKNRVRLAKGLFSLFLNPFSQKWPLTCRRQ